jgi:hypothetical protein
VGESSKPRVTSRILLNKWQCQQEKERYQKHKYEEEKWRYEEEMYRKEQEKYMREQERAQGMCHLQTLLERGFKASHTE